jgi:hypothetical protein
VATPTGFPEFFFAWVKTQTTDLLPLLTATNGTVQVSDFQGGRLWQPPRIDYMLASGTPVHSFAGPSGLNGERWQLNCWGATAAQARLVARLVAGTKQDRRLDGFQGTLANLTVQACLLLDNRDVSQQMSPGTDVPTFCQQLDFHVWSSPN